MSVNDTSPVNLNQAQVYTDLNSLQQIKMLGKNDKSAALEKIAHQFESMMMQMMMKSMRDANSVFSDGDITSSSEGKFYQDMSDSQLTLSLSQGKGMGIAAAIMRQFQSRYDGKAGIDPSNVNHSIADVQRMAASMASNPDSMPANPAVQEAIYRLFGGEEISAVGGNQEDNIPLDGTPQNFVEKLRPAAERIAGQLGVDSRVLLSQSALETGWGQKVLQCADGSSSFNFFNIKAGDNWSGAVVKVPTIEYQNGVAVREWASFRAYNSPEESFADYARLVSENPRYQQALECADNPRAYIKALAQAGYATDPNYASKVLSLYDSEHVRGSINANALVR